MLNAVHTVKNNLGLTFLYLSVLIVSSFTRLFQLGSIKTLIFDEKYYVKDGYSILNYGYEKQWISNYSDNGKPYWEELMGLNSEQFAAGNYVIASSEYWSAHPPLGKIFIALGMFFAGHDSPFGWRIASAAAGIITVGLTMILAYVLFKKHSVAIAAGLMVGIDGLMIPMSRISYLDSFLTMLLIGSTLFAVLFYKTAKVKYLYFAAITAGLAMGVKWSTFFFILFGLIALIIWEIVSNRNTGNIRFLVKYGSAGVISIISYVSVWIPWMLTYGYNSAGNIIGSISQLYTNHFNMFKTLKGASNGVFNNTSFLEWMTVSRPSFIYYEYVNESMAKVIITMPNLALWFPAVLALIIATVRSLFLKKSNPNLVPLLIVFTSLWLPWILQYDRITFQYYASSFTPYLYIILAYYFILFTHSKINRMIKQNLVFVWVILSALWAVFMFNISTGISNPTPAANIGFIESWYEVLDDSIFYDTTQDGYDGSMQIY